MAVIRTDIEKALDELKSYEDGIRFQGLAVVLGKQCWPELIAVGLIRFGGHVPKGGYDVQNGIQQGGETCATTVL